MTSVLLVEADELSGVFGKISIELGVSCAVLSGDMGEWERNKAETVLLARLRCSDAEIECQTPQIICKSKAQSQGTSQGQCFYTALTQRRRNWVNCHKICKYGVQGQETKRRQCFYTAPLQ